MENAYSQELRVDTSRIVIPIFTIALLLISLVLTITSTDFTDVWHFWLIGVAAPLGGWLAWHFVQKNQADLGTNIFLVTQVLIISLLMLQEWVPGNVVPYLFGVLIVATAMFKRAESSFFTWALSSLVIVGVAVWRFGTDYDVALMVTGPVLMNFALAGVAYLSAVEWQYAVESVSDLHRNAQRRRDELFAIQEEVKRANGRLEFSNKQLDLARQEALDERDIRTRFMNHVSHELRTPLNAIVNFAHILAQGGRGEVNEMQADYLARIEKSGWHLLSVLNDLLDMAQIQAGEFKLYLEVTDMYAICEEAMTSTRGLILEEPVDLVRDYPEEWPLVYIDRMRVKQSLINLLGNAVKYTEEGTITLCVRQDEDKLLLIVEDTGIGIPPEYHEAIFKEFRQVNESAARRRVGTGLGLPITRHLIERHQGEVWVESESGKGSRFYISLPILPPDEVEEDANGKLQRKVKPEPEPVLVEEEAPVVEVVAA
jgi:signal transduction histidine kinase